MSLFNNHEEGLSKQTNHLPVAAISIVSSKQTLFEILTGEENPRSIGGLLLILVLLMHLWGSALADATGGAYHAGATADNGSVTGFRAGRATHYRSTGTAQSE